MLARAELVKRGKRAAVEGFAADCLQPITKGDVKVKLVPTTTTVPVIESTTTVPVIESTTTVPVIESTTTVL